VKGYLVDTNVPSELTRDTPDARVVAFLRRAGKESLFLRVMTLMTRNVKDFAGLSRGDALIVLIALATNHWPLFL
jgi:predicted nucleic acid-binding protein